MKHILSGKRFLVHLAATFALVALVACSDDPGASLPGPQLAQGGNNQCDLKTAVSAARSYFQDNGNGSIKDQALEVLDTMDAACEATSPNTGDYTDGFFRVAALIQESLEMQLAGDPADGNTLLRFLITLQSPQNTAMFKPCDGSTAPSCSSYDVTDGDPPNFTGPLSEGGAFAVVNTDVTNDSAQAICEGHEFDCMMVDPTTDTWGTEPEVSWWHALYGAPSLITGEPIAYNSNEDPYALEGYRWKVIPYPDPFQSTVVVGLCSDEDPAEEALLQKDGTVLEEATLDFCDATKYTLHEAPTSILGRLAAYVGDLFDPRPRPLVATAFRLGGPGGGSGSWSDFFPIDIVPDATFKFENPPIDGTAGEKIVGQYGGDVKILAVTDPQGTPIEKVFTTITISKNNGFLQAGDVQVGDGADASFQCDPSTGTCTGYTRPDEDGDDAGSLTLPIILTKTGAYRICVTGELNPLRFDTVCAGPFNIRP